MFNLNLSKPWDPKLKKNHIFTAYIAVKVHARAFSQAAAVKILAYKQCKKIFSNQFGILGASAVWNVLWTTKLYQTFHLHEGQWMKTAIFISGWTYPLKLL